MPTLPQPEVGVVGVGRWPVFGGRCYLCLLSEYQKDRLDPLYLLGIPPEEVKMATRSRKGYWRMSANSIVQRALTNRWLHKQGVPDMRKTWIVLHYGPNARV